MPCAGDAEGIQVQAITARDFAGLTACWEDFLNDECYWEALRGLGGAGC